MVLGILLAALAAAGCDGAPDDVPMPKVEPGAGRTPVILIPGAEASTLVSGDGEVLWAATFTHLFDPSTFEHLARPLTPGLDSGERLIPADIIRGFPGEDYYAGLIQSLAQRAGGPCVLPDAVGPKSRCILFPWDWRLDLPLAAARLDKLIDHVRRVQHDPALRVDLVGHSAGGLVVRYFVRFGARDVLQTRPEQVRVDFAGARKVRRAALIAAPNDGSVYGLKLMMRGHQLGLVALRPELLAVMPAAYQALPRPDRPWVVDMDGGPLPRDLYDPSTWRVLRQSIFDPQVRRRVREEPDGKQRLTDLEDWFQLALERGRRFQLALARPVRMPFAYDIFAADCAPTPTHFVEERIDGVPRLRFSPDEIEHPRPGVDYAALMYGPGDGWVTRSSALGRSAHQDPPAFDVQNAVLGCAGHAELPRFDSVRNTLVGILTLADVDGRWAAVRFNERRAGR